jgi:hypothetical protein
LSHRYYYLPLSWKSWNWFECAVGGVPAMRKADICVIRKSMWWNLALIIMLDKRDVFFVRAQSQCTHTRARVQSQTHRNIIVILTTNRRKSESHRKNQQDAIL